MAPRLSWIASRVSPALASSKRMVVAGLKGLGRFWLSTDPRGTSPAPTRASGATASLSLPEKSTVETR